MLMATISKYRNRKVSKFSGLCRTSKVKDLALTYRAIGITVGLVLLVMNGNCAGKQTRALINL